MIAVRGAEQSVLDDTLSGCATARPGIGFPRRDPLDVLWAIRDLEDLGGNTAFDTSPVQGPENLRRIDYLFDAGLYDLPNAERPECHRDGTTYTSVYGRMHPDRPAPTITTGIGTPGQGRFIHPTRRRLVSPHEAARIQSFPSGYGFLGAEGETPRKALAKWIGDAVPPYLGMAAICAALSVSLGASPALPWDDG
ncbi:MAG: DNA cytosine methyltransferase [Shimia sp.]